MRLNVTGAHAGVLLTCQVGRIGETQERFAMNYLNSLICCVFFLGVLFFCNCFRRVRRNSVIAMHAGMKEN